jgi:hypothetical protein
MKRTPEIKLESLSKSGSDIKSVAESFALNRLQSMLGSGKSRLFAVVALLGGVAGIAMHSDTKLPLLSMLSGSPIQQKIEDGTMSVQNWVDVIGEARTNGDVRSALEKCDAFLHYAIERKDRSMILQAYELKMSNLAHVDTDRGGWVNYAKFVSGILAVDDVPIDVKDDLHIQREELTQKAFDHSIDLELGAPDIPAAIRWSVGTSFVFPPNEHSLNTVSFAIERGDRESLEKAMSYIKKVEEMAQKDGENGESIPGYKNLTHAKIVIEALLASGEDVDGTRKEGLQNQLRLAFQAGSVSRTISSLHTIAVCFPEGSEVQKALREIAGLKVKNMTAKTEAANAIIDAFVKNDQFTDVLNQQFAILKDMPQQPQGRAIAQNEQE